MAGCNCKKDINGLTINNEFEKKSLTEKILGYTLKIFAFSLMIVALPLINIAIIWFIFRTLILNKEVDIKPLLLSIGEKFKFNEEEDDDDDDEYLDLTEEDVELMDVEDITYRSK